MLRKNKLLSWVFGFSAMLAAGFAQANDTVRVIHGQAHGGTTDILARVLAEGMEKRLDKTFIVENRPGAATSLAAAMVAKSKPDGNTLLFTASGHSANPFLFDDLPYNTKEDFVGLGIVGTTPYVLVVTPSLPVSTPQELVEYLKDADNDNATAITSIGSAQHMAAALFREMAGVDMEFIPYKGSSDQVVDVSTGRVPIAFDNIVAAAEQIKSGRLKALAVTSKERSEMFPDIPTLHESGFEDFEILGWFGALAPAGTPEEIIEQYNAAIVDMKTDPDFSRKVTSLGADVAPGGSAEAEAFIQGELDKTEKLITDLNISIE